MSGEKVSVVLPVFNEEGAVVSVVSGVKAVMDKTGRDYEIIVVDDCSTDKTAAILKGLPVRVITHEANRGVGAARKTGIRAASGSIIVMIDTDGTYPADSIPQLLAYLPEYDHVVGARTSERGTVRLLRQPVKWFLFRLASYLAKSHIPDLNSGMRAFKKDIMMKYLYLIPNGFSCVSTMTLSFLNNDHRVKYVPIEYFKRNGKSKFRIVVHTRDMFFTILRMCIYFNPLRLFLPLSAVLLICGALLSFHHRMGAIVLFLFGVQMFTFGLLADLIVNQEKGRSAREGR
jgi:polyisoprenyl-phosphate glycosyltransferase